MSLVRGVSRGRAMREESERAHRGAPLRLGWCATRRGSAAIVQCDRRRGSAAIERCMQRALGRPSHGPILCESV
jgi:hypothetical protein